MFNILLRILAVMATFVVLVLLIGTLLPRNFESTSSVFIETEPEEIFQQLNTMKMWSNWSMWNAQDIVGLDVDYSGPPSGVGATQSWHEPRGEGKLWITGSQPNEKVNFASRFANFPEMLSSISLTPEKGGTRVEWKSTGSLPGGPFYGWFGLTFADSLSAEYKKSLQRLKRQCEQNRAAAETGKGSFTPG